MTNPIDNGPRFNGSVVSTTRAQGVSTAAPARKEAVDTLDRGYDAGVESERLQLIKERIDSTPEVDVVRVEAIKQSIAEGKYPLDPQRIAEKFAQLEGLLNS